MTENYAVPVNPSRLTPPILVLPLNRSTETGQLHFVHVVDAATSGLYRCCLCALRVRDVDRLVLREVVHGIDTTREPATEMHQQSLAQGCGVGSPVRP